MVKAKNNFRGLLLAVLALLIAALTGAVININIQTADISTDTEESSATEEAQAEVKYAEVQIPAQIDETILNTKEGDIKVDDVPTVEAVDGGQVTECPEESVECAKGAYLPPIDITSPETFYASVIDQCVDFDGAWGSQCYDLFAYFHYVYTGHWLSTNGTGAAYGIWDARDFNNPINPETGETYYVFITDPKQIKTGAFSVFYGGKYGHVGDAMGEYNNGFVSLFGTNQGGRSCPGGGSAANVINISMSNFRGAFMPRIWIQPDPAPEPEPEQVDSCKVWNVQKGDTLGKIMKVCRGEIKWGAAMNEYASHWFSTKFQLYLTVYAGWASDNGVGLFAGDTIEYRE